MGWRAFRRGIVIGSAAVLAALVAGCGGTDTRWGDGHYKVGRPYQINGKWYYPEFDPAYDRIGLASWYGDAFDGLATANGEVFSKDEISAAHPTMPLPSIARVTNLENGRSLDLRVNDRGPFVGDRVIDLSQAAARKLGFEHAGLAQVRVKFLRLADARGNPPYLPAGSRAGVARRSAPEALSPPPIFTAQRSPVPSATVGPPLTVPPSPAPSVGVARGELAPLPPPPPPRPVAPPSGPRGLVLADAGPSVPVPAAVAPPPPPPLPPSRPGRPASACRSGPQWVQVGAFADSVRVRATAAALRGVERVVIEPYFAGGAAVARVKLGPVPDLASALAVLDRVQGLGYPGAFVVPASYPAGGGGAAAAASC